MDTSLSAWAVAGFSGSIAVSTGGATDCLAAYGSADDRTPNSIDTTFSIGSITKAFTAATVYHLADDGKLKLDDMAGDLLPELKGPVRAATVHQLLLHTSGLKGTHGNDTQPMSEKEALKAIGKLELAAQPGKKYLYSNAGYTLLALIVERVSGSGYRDYLKSEILPLPDGRTAGGFWNGQPAAPGPRAVGYRDDGTADDAGEFSGPYWAVEGNGGLAMTTAELATWTHALFTGKIVSAASTRAIATPGRDIGEGRSEAPGWVAYDTSLYGEPLLATAGGGGDIGHNAVVVWLPRRQRVIAMASNKPKISAEELLQAVGPAMVAGKPLPVPRAQASKADLDAVVGTYQLGAGGSLTATVRDDRLAITAVGADAVAAIFPPPAGVPGSQLRAHEEMVGKLLAGETQEGRKERAAFEKQIGPMGKVTFLGSIAHGGEIRTYVSVLSSGKPVLGWFALNEEGGVEAAEVPTKEHPTLQFLPSGDNRYHPDDPTGVRPDVSVGFAKDRMTVNGPNGATTSAQRVG
ncbi:serine hydrolase domain-containing protein [Plantactinospora alkalitolerans]|uniref:serine hydrolase domain-containing protein n=1 Tax=Plantactinospora alkalitolerans TaxID=2789879 RepID=UPI0018ACB85B|nr:serine hydrolase domain-containing protein [Plantactinospora alkalitolerans]